MAQKIVCPAHPRAQIVDVLHDGDRVCSVCGIVLDRIINEGEDWRSFSNSEKGGGSADPSRVGEVSNSLLRDNELKTYVSKLPGVDLEFLNSLAGGQGASKNKSLQTSYRYIGHLCERLALPRAVLDQSKALFKEVDDTQAVKGRSNETIAATVVYIVCSERGNPRSIKEICAASQKEKKDISRCFKKISAAIKVNQKAVDPFQLIRRSGADLALPLDAVMAAEHAAKMVKELGLSPSRSPVSIAAAVLYLVSRVSIKPLEFVDVEKATGAMASTIRTAYCDLYPAKDFLFPANFTFRSRLADIPFHGAPKDVVNFEGRARDLGIVPVSGEPLKFSVKAEPN